MRGGLGQYWLSEPVPLEWCGWRSDTYTLHRCGWQISANEDFREDRLGIAFQHADYDVRGFGYFDRWGYRRLLGHDHDRMLHEPLRQQAMQIEVVGRNIYSHGLARMDRELWRAVDPVPQLRMERPARIEDIVHFAPISQKQDIILRPDTVPELMEKILKLQEPMREKYFREQALEDRAGRQSATVHARLISIGG
jgi:hypothetical protein